MKLGLLISGIGVPITYFLGMASFVPEVYKGYFLAVGTFLFAVFGLLLVLAGLGWPDRPSRFPHWFFLPLRYLLPISIAPIPRFRVFEATPDCHFSKIKVCYRALGHWVKKNRKSTLIMYPPIPPNNPNDRRFELLEALQFYEWQSFTTRQPPEAENLFGENQKARDSFCVRGGVCSLADCRDIPNCGGVLGPARHLFITWYLNPADVQRYLQEGEIYLERGPIAEMRYFLTMLYLRTAGQVKKNQGDVERLSVNRYMIVNEAGLSNAHYLEYAKSVLHCFLIENANYRIRFVSEESLGQGEEIALFKDMALFSNRADAIEEAQKDNDEYPLPIKPDYYNLLQHSDLEDYFLYLYYTLNKKDIQNAVRVATHFVERIRGDDAGVNARIRRMLVQHV